MPICKHLRGNGHRNIRALRVPLSPNVHLPWSSFASVSISPVPGSPKYTFFSNTHFPKYSFFQVPICPKSPFILRCPFTPVPICSGAHFPQMSICPKCPFTPNSLSQVAPLHTQVAPLSGLTLPPFVQDLRVRSLTQLSGIHLSWCSFVRNPFVWDQFILVPNYPGPNRPGSIFPIPIRPGAHLSETYLSGTHLPGTHFSAAQLSRTHLS